jgi:hypothetical protein
VIIMIDQENVEKFAQDNDVPFSNYASLTRAPEVQQLIQDESTASTRSSPASNRSRSSSCSTPSSAPKTKNSPHHEAQAQAGAEEIRAADRGHVPLTPPSPLPFHHPRFNHRRQEHETKTTLT